MAVTYIFHYDPPAVADPGDELGIQTRLRARCKMWASGRFYLVAIPNGGKRTAWEGMKAKREGLAKGFPDLMALWEGGHAYLEIKDRKGSLSPEQVDWLNSLHVIGKPCGCFRSVDTAIAFLRAAGAPLFSNIAVAEEAA